MTSKAARLPFELSPVSRKRTVSGPTRMVSSEGLTCRSEVCSVMSVSLSVHYVYHDMIVNPVDGHVNTFITKKFTAQSERYAHRRTAARSGSCDPPAYH